VQQALAEGATVRVSAARALDGDASRPVSVEVVPILDAETRSRCLLVVFEEGANLGSSSNQSPAPRAAGGAEVDQRVRELEQDLTSTKEYLQATIEELETSNEELKSTNEELQSANEELQSTNEELETSKEELQSTNEELSTMNDELQHRMVDLSRSNSDLDNLMLYVEHPVLFVDLDLRVRRVTDAAQKLLRLGTQDLGRSLAQLQGVFGGADVETLVRTTMSRLVATSERVRIGQRWHEMRAVPYRSPGGMVDGALLMLRDVDADQRRRELLLDVEAYAEKLLAALPQPLAIVDAQLRVLWVNKPFLDTFHVDVHATVGNLIQNLGSGQWAHPKLRAAMEGSLASGQPFRDFPVEHDFEAIGRRTMAVSGSVVTGLGGAERALLLTIVPLTAAGAAS
jgi:two-component system CheB/CheR fusion protein